ncbi:hypothetical protein NDU88_008108 [Pleurodeles waltl]|uniref:Uncharacterized protein n=1 Tax=Pleurodeles waltl TaxID=8319 RepID=A0AAV7NV29_PLEWA|nr:hypothetical protein NDU88_008108 [Pleurodeles waltl]
MMPAPKPWTSQKRDDPNDSAGLASSQPLIPHKLAEIGVSKPCQTIYYLHCPSSKKDGSPYAVVLLGCFQSGNDSPYAI